MSLYLSLASTPVYPHQSACSLPFIKAPIHFTISLVEREKGSPSPLQTFFPTPSPFPGQAGAGEGVDVPGAIIGERGWRASGARTTVLCAPARALSSTRLAAWKALPRTRCEERPSQTQAFRPVQPAGFCRERRKKQTQTQTQTQPNQTYTHSSPHSPRAQNRTF